MTTPDTPPKAGDQVGRYVFLRDFTSGPLGALWEARADADGVSMDALGRVLLLPHAFDPEQQQLLAEAAWNSTELRHEAVLGVADVVFGKTWMALVHDFSEGTMLRSLLLRAEERTSAFTVSIAARIALDISRALKESAKLSDSLGIPWLAGGVAATSIYVCGDGTARLLDGYLPAAAMRLPSLRANPGALAYAAPEQLDPSTEPDERADVFSIGLIIRELLVGRQLLSGTQAAISQRLQQGFLPLAKEISNVVEEVAKVVDRALQLDPDKRFPSLAEFEAALTASAPDIANRGEVIEFVDALLHRESTLFRLLADPAPRLSEHIKSVRPPKPDLAWAVDLARRAKAITQADRPGATRRTGASADKGKEQAAAPSPGPADKPSTGWYQPKSQPPPGGLRAGPGMGAPRSTAEGTKTSIPAGSAAAARARSRDAIKATAARTATNEATGSRGEATTTEGSQAQKDITTGAVTSRSQQAGKDNQHRPQMKTLIGLNASDFLGTRKNPDAAFRAALDDDRTTGAGALQKAFPGARQTPASRPAVRVASGSSGHGSPSAAAEGASQPPRTAAMARQQAVELMMERAAKSGIASGANADETQPGLGFAEADPEPETTRVPERAALEAARASEALENPPAAQQPTRPAEVAKAKSGFGKTKIIAPPSDEKSKPGSSKPFAIVPPGAGVAEPGASTESGDSSRIGAAKGNEKPRRRAAGNAGNYRTLAGIAPEISPSPPIPRPVAGTPSSVLGASRGGTASVVRSGTAATMKTPSPDRAAVLARDLKGSRTVVLKSTDQAASPQASAATSQAATRSANVLGASGSESSNVSAAPEAMVTTFAGPAGLAMGTEAEASSGTVDTMGAATASPASEPAPSVEDPPTMPVASAGPIQLSAGGGAPQATPFDDFLDDAAAPAPASGAGKGSAGPATGGVAGLLHETIGGGGENATAIVAPHDKPVTDVIQGTLGRALPAAVTGAVANQAESGGATAVAAGRSEPTLPTAAGVPLAPPGRATALPSSETPSTANVPESPGGNLAATAVDTQPVEPESPAIAQPSATSDADLPTDLAPFPKKRSAAVWLALFFGFTSLALAGVVVWLLQSKQATPQGPKPAEVHSAQAPLPSAKPAASAAEVAKAADTPTTAPEEEASDAGVADAAAADAGTEEDAGAADTEGAAAESEADTNPAPVPVKPAPAPTWRPKNTWRPRAKAQPKKKTYVPNEL